MQRLLVSQLWRQHFFGCLIPSSSAHKICPCHTRSTSLATASSPVLSPSPLKTQDAAAEELAVLHAESAAARAAAGAGATSEAAADATAFESQQAGLAAEVQYLGGCYSLGTKESKQ